MEISKSRDPPIHRELLRGRRALPVPGSGGMAVSDARSAYDHHMSRTRGVALVLVGLLIIVSDSFDAIDDGLSGWNVVTIVLGVFLLLSGIIGLRRTTA
jgi:hypothetical protein